MTIPTTTVIAPRLDFQPGESPFQEDYLPESDGRPMAETDRHRKLMISLLHALMERFRKRADVYVSGNIFIYYFDESGALQSVSPDIFVVFGAPKKDRRVYNLKYEGKAPGVVIELTSTSTKIEDLVSKHYIYAKLGVREYFLFDPHSEAIQPMLRGFRLEGGEYLPMSGNRIHSEVLELDLVTEAGELRLYDPLTGERLLTPEEAEVERRAEKAARLAAEARAANQEAENARLRDELAKLQAQKS